MGCEARDHLSPAFHSPNFFILIFLKTIALFKQTACYP